MSMHTEHHHSRFHTSTHRLQRPLTPSSAATAIFAPRRGRTSTKTMCNVESSRSHGVFSVRVISAEPTPWGGEVTRDGRLSLVDLSGSENIKRSGAVGDRAKEAAAIGQVPTT